MALIKDKALYGMLCASTTVATFNMDNLIKEARLLLAYGTADKPNIYYH